jgi:hypothetical protein
VVNPPILSLPPALCSEFSLDIHNAYEETDFYEVRGIVDIAKQVYLSFVCRKEDDRYESSLLSDDHEYSGYYDQSAPHSRALPSELVFHLCDGICVEWHSSAVTKAGYGNSSDVEKRLNQGSPSTMEIVSPFLCNSTIL